MSRQSISWLNHWLVALSLLTGGCRSTLYYETGNEVPLVADAALPPVDFGHVADLAVAPDLIWIEHDDLSLPPDLSPPPAPDLWMNQLPDFTLSADFETPPDLSRPPPDLTVPFDLTTLPDFTLLPDLTMPTCNDGIKNGRETDVDCGGPACPRCGGGKGCQVAADCASNACPAGRCRAKLQFAAGGGYPVLGTPVALAAADFNADGRTDLAAADFDNSFVALLVNRGGGGFQSAVLGAAATQPVAIAAADFNGDSRTDVATAGANGVLVIYGNGNGGFSGSTSANAPLSPAAVSAADYDRDGRSDLLVAERGTIGGDPGGLLLLLAGPNNTFARNVFVRAGTYPDAVWSGDLDSDGLPDALAADLTWPGAFYFFHGNGQGGLQQGWSATGGANPTALTVADWNADGQLDFAATDSGTDDVASWIGIGASAFKGPAITATVKLPIAITTADFDLDGRPDIALTSGSNQQNMVAILLGNGDGSFSPGLSIGAGSGTGSIVTLDADGDGRPDLAVTDAGGSRVAILLNTSL